MNESINVACPYIYIYTYIHIYIYIYISELASAGVLADSGRVLVRCAADFGCGCRVPGVGNFTS